MYDWSKFGVVFIYESDEDAQRIHLWFKPLRIVRTS